MTYAGILTGNPLPVPEAASNQPGCLHAANSLVQADSNRNCNLDAPVQSVMPSDFTMPVQVTKVNLRPILLKHISCIAKELEERLIRD